jgi:hypothetical protein
VGVEGRSRMRTTTTRSVMIVMSWISIMTVIHSQQSASFTFAETVVGGIEKEAIASVSESAKLSVIEMKVSNLYPESFDWDAKHNRFIVGSTTQGRLMTVTEAGIVEEFATVLKGVEEGVAIAGVRVDLVRNRVLALVQTKEASALVAYDLDSKKRTLFVDLLEDEEEEDFGIKSGRRALGQDVAVDNDGNAFVTNSRGNSIWKVSPDGSWRVFVELPKLPIGVDSPLSKAVTCNGIIHHDGYLVVAQTNSGRLFWVRLSNKRVINVTINPAETLFPEAHGMVLRSDGSLVVLSSRTAWLLSTRDYWRSASLLDKVSLNEVTSGAAVKSDLRVFTIHGHISDKMNGVDRDVFKMVEIEFPSDHDNNPLWLLLILGIFGLLVLAWRFQMDQFNKAYTKKRA